MVQDLRVKVYRKFCQGHVLIKLILLTSIKQYRILHREIVTNVHLCRWKSEIIVQFCGKEGEMYLPVFIFWEHVQNLWIKLEPFLNCFLNVAIKFGTETAL